MGMNQVVLVVRRDHPHSSGASRRREAATELTIHDTSTADEGGERLEPIFDEPTTTHRTSLVRGPNARCAIVKGVM